MSLEASLAKSESDLRGLADIQDDDYDEPVS